MVNLMTYQIFHQGLCSGVPAGTLTVGGSVGRLTVGAAVGFGGRFIRTVRFWILSDTLLHIDFATFQFYFRRSSLSTWVSRMPAQRAVRDDVFINDLHAAKWAVPEFIATSFHTASRPEKRHSDGMSGS